jgi:transcriptional regulator with XRE-family HTH domain
MFGGSTIEEGSLVNKSLRGKWHRAVTTIIAASRREVGMTQADLARTLGWHRSRVAKIECGERRVDVPEFIEIAYALRLDSAVLLTRVVRWAESSAVDVGP